MYQKAKNKLELLEWLCLRILNNNLTHPTNNFQLFFSYVRILCNNLLFFKFLLITREMSSITIEATFPFLSELLII